MSFTQVGSKLEKARFTRALQRGGGIRRIQTKSNTGKEKKYFVSSNKEDAKKFELSTTSEKFGER